MTHTLFIATGNDFRTALAFTDRACEIFGNAIKIACTGKDKGEFGSFFTFNDVRCIPALFDLAKNFAK